MVNQISYLLLICCKLHMHDSISQLKYDSNKPVVNFEHICLKNQTYEIGSGNDQFTSSVAIDL
jgi:hypothetical protein